MVTRFVPGGYQPSHDYVAEPVADKVHRAVQGLGDLIDGYEFHYPNELSHDNLEPSARGARRPRRLLHRRRAAPRPALRPRRARQPRPAAPRRGAADRPRGRRVRRLAGRPSDHLARWRGLQLPLPDAVRRVLGLADRGDGRGSAGMRAPRGQAAARAQELRAGDEDPDAQHRHVPARRPQAPGTRPSTTSRSTWTGSTC